MDNTGFEPDQDLVNSSNRKRSHFSVIDKLAPQPQDNVGLKREVGLLSAIALTVGTIIGSGIFVTPGDLLKRSGSVWLSLLIWFACGILSMLGAISYIELGTVVPSSGGEYSYLLKAFGAVPAFLFSWVSTTLLKPSSLAIVCLAFSQYTVQPFVENLEDVKWAVMLICICTILLLIFVNCVSVKLAIQVQNFFTVAKLLAIAIIIGTGIFRLCQGHTKHLQNGFEGSDFNYGNLAIAFYNGLWAYDGWNQLNYITEEIKNPYKNLPLALLIGLPLVTVCYILVNISFLTVLSPEDIKTSSSVAIDFGNNVLGVMAFLMPLSVALSTFGAANGSNFTAARLGFVAGREGHVVDCLSYIDIKRSTPSPAIIFNGIIALVMAVTLNIGELIDFFSFTAWIFYGASMAALIRLRYSMPYAPRPFKVPIVVPVIVLLISIFLVVAPIANDPKLEYLYASLFIVFGLFLYIPFVYFRLTLPGMELLNQTIQKLFQVSPQDENGNDIRRVSFDSLKTKL